MSTHTPGPWSIKTNTYFGGEVEQGDVVDANGRTIRVFGMALTSTPESKANARLIAAAPDLLEALYTAEALLLSMGMQSSDAYQEINAAIAKAEGKS